MKNYNKLFNELGFLMGHTGRALKNSITKSFAEHGYEITLAQWGILMYLWSKDGITQQELSGAVSKEKTTVVRLIDNMEKRNIIVRIRDKDDRRNNLIFLTKEGKRIREKLVPIATNEFRKALKNLSEKEIDTLTSLLKKVYNNLKTDKCVEN